MIGYLGSGRPWLVPEVVQTSAMDCGPAVLKCLLAGYGIKAHYGRLREACQADIDGTSINTLEEVAGQLGLEVAQVMLPLDHLLLSESQVLPALVVTSQPDGATHFVLLWRRHGRLVQVMDPGIGRRFMTCEQFLQEVYLHSQQVPVEAWQEWAVSDGMRRPMARRLRQLGVTRQVDKLIQTACEKPGWRPIAALDASIRLTESLVRSGGAKRGEAAGRIVRSLFEAEISRPENEPTSGPPLIPFHFWSVSPAPPDSDGEPQLTVSGAVLLSVSGRKPIPTKEESEQDAVPALGPELAAALAESDDRPLAELWRVVRGAGWTCLLGLIVCLFLMAGAAVGEALILRGVIDLGRDLALVEQRLIAVGCFLGLGLAAILLEVHLVAGLLRLGRRLESMLRVAFLEKIPRLHDRYFQSRAASDMAERGHSMYLLRSLPYLAGGFFRTAATLIATAAVIAWLDPANALIGVVAALMAILLPVAFLPILAGHDLRVRTHMGALTRFYLDSLLGVAAIRAHGAQRAIHIEHESRLAEWSRASGRRLRWLILVDGLQSLTGIALAGWLLMLHAHRATDATGVLLIAYWALSLPTLGAEIAASMHEYPSMRNITLRLLEPLGALESETTVSTGPENVSAAPVVDEPGDDRVAAQIDIETTEKCDTPPGVEIQLEGVSILAGGHTILEGIDLAISPGSHVAVVGVSGAGKSSLVGLLLGWHQCAAGRVLVDQEILTGSRLDALRCETAWVDPAVQLWNQSLLENLLYGDPSAGLEHIGEIVRQADLYGILQQLPEGLQTGLGEGGGLLSGGEGQRVRFGRASVRDHARLVILDEPFRGLERDKRRKLLERARLLWQSATLLCVTHDVGETLDFPRVLVLDEGRIIEDGPPCELAADPQSRYSALLADEEGVRTGMWASPIWRRLRLNSGRMTETPSGGKKEIS
jgi:ABC-type bacteriocin/lantibiotic exporter with double-glycine peptidase domain